MFRFKRFTIEQDRTPMKVGTDGVLLGAWVSIRGDERLILDIGTGTGVIALMMAQRSEADVEGVEIDQSSAEQASENVEASPWSDRVNILRSDIQSFAPESRYDLIVTNPPYFVDSLLSPDGGRSVARHTTELSFKELVVAATRLLNPNGRFALILPTAESQLFDRECEGVLWLVRRCEVFSREGGAVKRIMSEYRLMKIYKEEATSNQEEATSNRQEATSNQEEASSYKRERITIESGRPPQFTDEYRALTADFYLKF